MVGEHLEDLEQYVQKVGAKMVVLEDDSRKILSAIIDRDDNVQANKRFFFHSVQSTHVELNTIMLELDHLHHQLDKLHELFKTTLKKDRFSVFEDTMNRIPFEFFLTQYEWKQWLSTPSKQ